MLIANYIMMYNTSIINKCISNKLFGIDSYVVVIPLLNYLGSIINYTKNFGNLINENKNLKG